MSGEPGNLEDFRVSVGVGRVVVLLIGVREYDGTPRIDPVTVGMSPAQARELAAHLVERAEGAETRSRRPG